MCGPFTVNVYLQGGDAASRFQDKETTWRWRSDRQCGSHCRVSHSSPSGHVKSCAHTPAQQSWKATVKRKMQNQRNGLTPGQGDLLSGSCSNDSIELSAQISAWKLMEMSCNCSRASDHLCLVLFIPPLLERGFVSRGCGLDLSSVFVIAALLKGKSEWKTVKNCVWQESRKGVWSVLFLFCKMAAKCPSVQTEVLPLALWASWARMNVSRWCASGAGATEARNTV